MNTPDLAKIARQQNEADAAAGHCSRYVEDVGVLSQVAAILMHEEEDGGDALAS